MTSLKIYSMFDYLTDTSVVWRKDDHKAMKIVKSVKGKPFNGHLEMKIKGKTRRFIHPDCGEAVNTVARIMAAEIAKLTDAEICLVPVPNSHVTVDVEDYQVLSYARRVAEHLPGRSFANGTLCWRVARPPQHKAKGQRHMSQFIGNLRLMRKPLRPIVLIDDMLTSGSQMLACKHVLSAAGHEVLFGMAVGRVAEEQAKKPIGWRDEVYHQDLIRK